jgi:hypothetical protein
VASSRERNRPFFGMNPRRCPRRGTVPRWSSTRSRRPRSFRHGLLCRRRRWWCLSAAQVRCSDTSEAREDELLSGWAAFAPCCCKGQPSL